MGQVASQARGATAREAAWIQALEAEAAAPGRWLVSNPDDDPETTGSLSGHSAQYDGTDGARRVWIGEGPYDEVNCN